MSIYRDPWVKKAKWLAQALIISCTLNVGFLSTLIYFAMSENGPLSAKKETIATDGKENLNLQSTLVKYSSLSFQDLLIRLGNNDSVESGCTRRDLALSCLVFFHHFNLEKALGGPTLQKKEILFKPPSGDPVTLILFPGLADYQFQAIVHYAKTEKWPLTSQGLFYAIQRSKPPYEPSLVEAFSLTPELHFLSLLFSKTGIGLKKEYLTALLSQATWPILSETTENLRFNSSFTLEERRHFLYLLAQNDSKIAAKILLESDQEYCLEHFEEESLLLLCNLLWEKTPSQFLKKLLASQSASVWKTAATILYDQAAEDLPKTLHLEDAKRRFIELKSASSTPTPAVRKKTKTNTYTVKSGDSLWKIAHDQNTTVKALREANNLHTDKLNIGQTLIIP